MLREAWRAMGANRLRTFLTMLGMVIGVGAVVLMMAIGQGAQYAVAQTISSMGSNIFVVLSGYTSTGGVRSGGGSAPTLNVSDADAIAELDGVDTVAPVHWGSVQMVLRPEQLERLGAWHHAGLPRRALLAARRGRILHRLRPARRHARGAARPHRRAEPVRRRRPGRQDLPHRPGALHRARRSGAQGPEPRGAATRTTWS
jgi:hypothetical protein